MPLAELDPYVLPTLNFVGGETQNLEFNVYLYRSTESFDVSGCTAQFSVKNYTNRSGGPVIAKSMGATGNKLTVTLSISDTIDLSGKYIYQISMKDGQGNADIPKQGLMYIIDNADKDFLRD